MATRDGEIAGHVFYSRARLESGPEVLALAPMAVLPERQRSGVGSALVTESLQLAAATSYPLVIVLGHADYYPRFGFEPATQLGIEAPFDVPPEAWMGFRLPGYSPDARGTVVYADASSERVVGEYFQRAMEPHTVMQSAYQRAALVHDRAAEFWERHGDPEKAAIERNKAQANRLCADFERLRLGRQYRNRAGERAGQVDPEPEVAVKLHSIYPPDPPRQ